MSLIVSEALSGLRRNVSMVISVVLVTFVSLTFVGAAILMQMQIAKMNDFWVDHAQVTIYMCSSLSTATTCADGAATAEQIQAVHDQLGSEALAPLVQSVRYETPEEAYESALATLPDGYDSIFRPDQWNATFWVNLQDHRQADVIAEAFSGTPGIEDVQDQLALLDTLFQALTVATYLAVGVAGLMLIAAVLLIATTIRLSAYARRRELGIMRLVGASNRTVQAPFELEGIFAALIGSGLASVAIWAGVQFGVDGYLRQRIPFVLTWVSTADLWIVIPLIVALGVVLAGVSAAFAIRRWLRA